MLKREPYLLTCSLTKTNVSSERLEARCLTAITLPNGDNLLLDKPIYFSASYGKFSMVRKLLAKLKT